MFTDTKILSAIADGDISTAIEILGKDAPPSNGKKSNNIKKVVGDQTIVIFGSISAGKTVPVPKITVLKKRDSISDFLYKNDPMKF